LNLHRIKETILNVAMGLSLFSPRKCRADTTADAAAPSNLRRSSDIAIAVWLEWRLRAFAHWLKA